MTRKLQFNLLVDVEDGITDSEALSHASSIVALGQHQSRELARLNVGARVDGNERDWHTVPVRLRVERHDNKGDFERLSEHRLLPGSIMFRVTGINPYYIGGHRYDADGRFCALLLGKNEERACLPISMRPDNPCDLMKIVGRTVRAELVDGVYVVNQDFQTGNEKRCHSNWFLRAALDAGNRSMQYAGRQHWDTIDWNVAMHFLKLCPRENV